MEPLLILACLAIVFVPAGLWLRWRRRPCPLAYSHRIPTVDEVIRRRISDPKRGHVEQLNLWSRWPH